MAVFGLRLTTFVTGVLVRRFELRWFDDICNVGCSLVARPGPAAAHGHRRLALSARWAACLKPLSPLLAGACVGLKPPSPLRVRNGRFWRSFRAQRCCRFQRSLVGGEQWCCRFQGRHVVAPCARKSSPCGTVVIVQVRKSSLSTRKMAQNGWYMARWANFFAEMRLEGVPGEFFRGYAAGGAVPGEF